ncbi:MAG: mechanosensitive ion channel [Ruminococcaceae bacterium]|nr:mechanosensitive ion channel [Oscillospiraceae bacterium]
MFLALEATADNNAAMAVLSTVLNWLATTGIKFVIGLIVMLIAFKVIDVLAKKINKAMTKKNVDETITRVSTGAIKVAAKLLVAVLFVGFIGIETASISACIATLGVGISLAVQGTLSNFAGGVIIILMRPFKLGDFITSGGESGTVEDIKLFYTHVVTVDNRMIYIPNGTLANNVIVNASVKDTRRLDITMSVAYESDTELACKLIREVCERNEKIFKEPAPFVTVASYAASSIDIVCRTWCNKGDYWDNNFYLLNEIKKEFDKNGIVIPYNQLDVHVNTVENK